jgi:hypothetical protein
MSNYQNERLLKNLRLTLSLSDEGLNMMLQRIRRDNPNSDEKTIKNLLRLELVQYGKQGLPRFFVPINHKTKQAKQ